MIATTARCDILSDNSDTGNDNGEFSDTTQQLPNDTTSDRLVNKHSVSSTDKGADKDEDDDIMLRKKQSK